MVTEWLVHMSDSFLEAWPSGPALRMAINHGVACPMLLMLDGLAL